ncbi:uncharacterized protein HMPREF1541_07957 [Cyphellophora europaea CBS 101466]|uniref:Uncharacterized protein n=1 Tax=Cyphellophora europaea (strain CBS 101466) TaxID=1220924 RepID=W2RMM2_CYPE1|nr:uncharacterized protein HMPREF1541_07957 [Cyphellophora europaea CBS 101466]ETN36969.1 hypothetical protein HMPREF1541_07957 [Cyphellophora europaea CBS 101466]
MKVYKAPRDEAIPDVDILTLLFEHGLCLAREDTRIHVDAANPASYVTKAQARTLTKRVAHVLRHHYGIGTSGVGKDRVLTIVNGSPFAPVFFYGLVAAGGIFCGAGTDYKVSDLVRQIKDSGTSLLVCSPECQTQAIEAADVCGISKNRLLILDSRNWRLLSAATGLDLLGSEELDWPRLTDPRVLEQTTICLLYSSGTTGLPKGVRISHRSLVANNVCTMVPARRYKIGQARRGTHFSFDTIAHLPMANIAGISLYATNPFYMGGTTYWMEKFDFDLFLGYHRRYRPHYQFTVPPIWLRIAKSDAVTDHFDALQVAVTGSAPVGLDMLKEVQKKLGRGHAYLSQTWGATECAGVITAQEWQLYSESGKWSVGSPCPNVSLRVVDEDDRDVEEGQPGELLVGGPILAQGYHNRPDADQETFTNGFYRTGDIGIIEDGLVQIIDRKKELIKYKGAQVAPAELEGLLTSHPRIADAAVIGIWNENQQTELPRAYVVRQPTTTEHLPITAEQVADFVKVKVSSHKRLRGGVVFLDEIPKSASGKILRKELRQKASKNEVKL